MYVNPFPTDPDRAALWEMLVERDIEAFIACDWERVEPDFLADAFYAIDAGKQANPDGWRLSFPTLSAYRDAWLKSARDMRGRIALERVRKETLAATTLLEIDIEGDLALLHKKFNGDFLLDDGEPVSLHWRTAYQCRKVDGRWRIVGFVGYLPYEAPAK